MTPQQLKNSILQLAIQGKLVEQRPEEGTAEALYRDIQAEKARLVKEGKIKKDKPLPEISDDELPFDIPESWKWAKLGVALLGIQAGKSYKCNEVPPSDDQCGLVKVSAVTWGKFDENESKTCYSNENWVDEYAIRKGDFLISRANTAELVGSCVIVNEIHKRLMLSDKILRLELSDKVFKAYILYLLRSPFIRAQFLGGASGTSNSMKNISQDTIRTLTLPLPPLAEQKRIVARIEELLPLVDRYEQAWTQLQALDQRFPADLQKSILQLAIQGRLVEQRPEEGTAEALYREIQKENIATDKSEPTIADDDIPFDVPESWKMVRIRNVAILYNGRAYKQNELLESGKYPVLRVGNLFTRNKWYYSDLELEPQKYCDSGDLLYSWSASFGPYIWNGEKVIYHYHIWKIEFSRYVDKKFFYYFLLADTDNIKRSGHGLAMIHVTKSGTEKRFFPLPPLAEQKRIVARIEELLPLCEALKHRVS